MFHRTQHPLPLCFLRLNVLCLCVSLDSTSTVFMFSWTQRPFSLCFHRTQRPLSLCFHRTQRPLSLWFIRLNVLCLYVFIGLNVLCFMFHRTQSPIFLFHETHFLTLSLNSNFVFVGTPILFTKDSLFSCCDLSKNHSNRINAFVFTYLLLSIKDK